MDRRSAAREGNPVTSVANAAAPAAISSVSASAPNIWMIAGDSSRSSLEVSASRPQPFPGNSDRERHGDVSHEIE